ncbi:receptor-like protein 42 [Henckelia pumila]|uniref:receptor-like protein 42 n=1 Tax=Henckelia pumila TaxID=405737 RepID=UPI003C6E1326
MDVHSRKDYIMFIILFHVSIIFGSSLALKPKTCHPTDEEALLHLKSRITDDPLGLLKTWTPHKDCCTQWDGVSCSSNRVVKVSRPGLYSTDVPVDTSMSGTLSPFLGNLTFLQLLDLSHLKYLEGPIPTEFGKLSRLNHLFLGYNNLMGSIPVTFKNLHLFKTLNLRNNRLSGSIHSDIFLNMTSLEQLDLSENHLSGPIPYSIGHMESLYNLDLHQNNLSEKSLNLLDDCVIPKSICNLSKLEDLSVPSCIDKLIALKYIELADNNLTGSIPPSIGKLSGLVKLQCDRNRLSGELPESLGNLTNLREIYLSSNQLTGRIPPSLGNLQYNLLFLDLSRNQLSGPIPSELIKIQHLQLLDLSFNPLGLGKFPDWFQKFSVLFQLFLSGTGLKGSLPTWLAASSL